MADKKIGPDQAALLRQQAEETARSNAAKLPEDVKALSSKEIAEMLHELRVHQIELEMQNDELRRTQVELETARERYFDIFDLAPVGYCTLNEQGLILEANLTITDLLGVTRGALVQQLFTGFILKEDQDAYYLRRKQLFETGTRQDFELRLAKKNGAVFWARLAATLGQDVNGGPVCRVMISDITERKLAGAQLSEQLVELRRWQDATLGREGRVIELKHEVNQLLAQSGQPPRYPSAEVERQAEE